MPKDTTELHDVLKQEQFRIITQNDTAFALIIKHPSTYGHSMVLPKRIVPKLSELTAQESKDILNLCEIISTTLSKMTNKDCVIIKNEHSHSSIAHLHFHILPSEANVRHLYSAYHKDAPLKTEADRETVTKMCNDVKSNL